MAQRAQRSARYLLLGLYLEHIGHNCFFATESDRAGRECITKAFELPSQPEPPDTAGRSHRAAQQLPVNDGTCISSPSHG
ncbi:hypothetical protein UY3_05896 [Chelonia mydas]|uniref:Uncharacterized protein n=1 Tax=Chelonia mydas TaxID=8469 RepID=M7BG83_CHEMY|nr:hypothetical protein UY3_05896 [Chelonia mydas]